MQRYLQICVQVSELQNHNPVNTPCQCCANVYNMYMSAKRKINQVYLGDHVFSCLFDFEVLVLRVAAVPEDERQENCWSTHGDKCQPVHLYCIEEVSDNRSAM